jgi:hypothetical protein
MPSLTKMNNGCFVIERKLSPVKQPKNHRNSITTVSYVPSTSKRKSMNESSLDEFPPPFEPSQVSEQPRSLIKSKQKKLKIPYSKVIKMPLFEKTPS